MSDELSVPLWETPPVTAPPAPKSMTLDQYLFAIEQGDDDLLDGVLPEHVLGGLKEKVDGIRHKLKLWEFQERFLRDEANLRLDAARVLAKKQERLDAYVKWVMEHRKFDEVPGIEFKISLKTNPASLKILKEEADALDHRDFPQYCEQVRNYRWKKDVVKDALKGGAELTFAKLTYGKRIEFDLNLPTEIPASTRKGKK